MKLKPNMYVRTKSGMIAKIIYKGYISDSLHREEIVFILDNGKILTLHSQKVVKASYNIIDLIQVGDYVNGYPVYETIEYPDNTRAIVIDDDNKSIIWEESSQYIKSIVTKEMFENMKYEVK